MLLAREGNAHWSEGMDATAYDEYWSPARDERLVGGVLSGTERTALLKIANGDWTIPSGDLACLLERRLIEITTGFIRLTDDGQVALGLPV